MSRKQRAKDILKSIDQDQDTPPYQSKPSTSFSQLPFLSAGYSATTHRTHTKIWYYYKKCNSKLVDPYTKNSYSPQKSQQKQQIELFGSS